MELPEQERVRLARELIASLDEEINPDVEALWLAEQGVASKNCGRARPGGCRRKKPSREYAQLFVDEGRLP
ncbi:MAG: addiction module protein [Deltaproteobacteria bacterium]|nr:addiction module protein [Deltaproteobacteria bacterium]MBI3387728.1 addiction module protein [Deltaproteobacteria bacterium]